MKLKSTKLGTPVSVTAIAMALNASVVAVSSGNDNVNEIVLEEVVVTAQRREQGLMEVPLGMQAFGGESLEKNGIDDMRELIGFVPGASEVTTVVGATRYQIRGISAFSGDATVGFYMDDLAFGIPGSASAPEVDAFDLERVEVLRGPMSTLYGESSMGGVIKVITVAPNMTDFQVKVDASYGLVDESGEDSYEGNIAINIPLISDKLALRFVGGHEKVAGFAESALDPSLKDVNGANVDNYRGKLKFTPTEDLTILATVWHNNVEKKMDETFSTVEPAVLSGNPADTVDTEFNMFSALIDYDLPSIAISFANSYLEYDQAQSLTTFLPQGTLIRGSDGGVNQYTSEFRLSSTNSSFLSWVGGLFYKKSDSNGISSTDSIFPGGFGSLLVESISKGKSRQWAAFGEVTFDLLDGKLTPLLGLRYHDEKRTGTGTTEQIGQGFFEFLTTPPSLVSTPDLNFTTLNPRFNLAYIPNDIFMAYINIAKGTRAGSTNGQATVDVVALEGITAPAIIDPDNVWSYDVGTKVTLADGNLQLEGAVYYNKWNDIQLNASTPGFFSQYRVNGGEAHAFGVDLAVNWATPIEGLILKLAANVNETEFDKVHPGVKLATSFSEGLRIDFVPGHTVSLSADYSTPVSEDLDAVIHASWVNTGKRVWAASTAGRFYGETTNMVSLRIGIEGEQWGVRLYADNLLDEVGPTTNFLDTLLQRPRPRQIGINFRFKYN